MVLLTLTRELDQKHFSLTLGLFIDQRQPTNPLWVEVEKLGVSSEKIRFDRPYGVGQFFDLYRIMANVRPHIIHTHGYKSNWFGLLMSKVFCVPIVSTLHGWIDKKTTKTSIITKIDCYLLNFFDAIIAVSEGLKTHLMNQGISDKKIVTIRNIPPHNFQSLQGNTQSLRSELGIPDSRKVIGFVGRLEPIKNCGLFLEAIDLVRKKVDGICALIVGEGSEQGKLEDQAKSLGLQDQVFFCGFRQDISQVYQSLNLYVLSSSMEGIPLTVLEAMASGIPIVATAVGGVKEVIQDGFNGLLVHSPDPGLLAKQIMASLQNTKETQERVNAGLRIIRKDYDVASWAQKFQNVYRKLHEVHDGSGGKFTGK